MTLDADAAGRFALDFRVYQEILFLVPSTEVDTRHTTTWATCSPCRLEVGDGVDIVSLPLELVPTDDPVLPQVTVDGIDGPLEPGGHVRVTGTGFQPGSAPDVWLAWCPQEVGGEEVFLPAGEVLLGCDVPDEDGYDIDGDGGFTIERFPLPESGADLAGRRCAARPGNCSFVWSHPNQFHQAALPPEQDLPLDLSG